MLGLLTSRVHGHVLGGRSGSVRQGSDLHLRVSSTWCPLVLGHSVRITGRCVIASASQRRVSESVHIKWLNKTKPLSLPPPPHPPSSPPLPPKAEQQPKNLLVLCVCLRQSSVKDEAILYGPKYNVLNGFHRVWGSVGMALYAGLTVVPCYSVLTLFKLSCSTLNVTLFVPNNSGWVATPSPSNTGAKRSKGGVGQEKNRSKCSNFDS